MYIFLRKETVRLCAVCGLCHRCCCCYCLSPSKCCSGHILAATAVRWHHLWHR